jgi:hypothetical protein
VLLQRYHAAVGYGIPVFLVWCTNCGYEVQISAAVAGMWDDLLNMPPDAEHPPVESPGLVAAEGDSE